VAAIIPPPGQDSFGKNTDLSSVGPDAIAPGANAFPLQSGEISGAPWANQATDIPTPTDPTPLDVTVNKAAPEGGSVTNPVNGRQWIRNWRITMGSSSGQNMDLSQLRMRFKVAYATAQHPTYADITITNPSQETANKVDKEGVPITLECGYENRLQLIFKGTAVYKRYGRESPTDTYLQIIARSGDKAYNHAHVSKTLEKGHTFKDQVKVATDAMKQLGVEVGHMAELDPRKFPRAITLHGMAREVMRRVAMANDASWTIHNGKVQMVKNKDGLPGSVIVISSETGMIGRPVQTFKGIEARMLLNPQIGPGSKVKIDEKSIDRIGFGSFSQGNFALAGEGNRGGDLSTPPLGSAQALATNGEYIVSIVEHSGDTRAQEWYTDIVCYNPQAPPTGGSIGADTNLAAIPYMGMPVTDENQNSQGQNQGQQGQNPSAGGT
jgi:hypothetical protein